MPEFQSFDGVTLHYDLEGEGAPVVLLHGFAADTNLNWRQPGIIQALAAAGRRTIGLDARGHGMSEKCYDPSAYANDAMVADGAALRSSRQPPAPSCPRRHRRQPGRHDRRDGRAREAHRGWVGR